MARPGAGIGPLAERRRVRKGAAACPLETLRPRLLPLNRLDEQSAAGRPPRWRRRRVRASIGRGVITAPFAGFASLLTISPGAWLNSAPLATIQRTSRPSLDFRCRRLRRRPPPGLTIEASRPPATTVPRPIANVVCYRSNTGR